MFEDNRCALQVVNGHKSLSRTKAIDLRRAVARQAVQRKLIRVEYIDTKKMLSESDILTKQPPADAFEAARAALGILPVDDGQRGASGETRRIHAATGRAPQSGGAWAHGGTRACERHAQCSTLRRLGRRSRS